MSIRPDGRPPFRADHVGSLLRPPLLRQAFKRHEAGEISESLNVRPCTIGMRSVLKKSGVTRWT